MAYKCPKCGHVSEELGDCPSCNVEMTESAQEDLSQEDSSQPAESQTESQPENN